MLLLTCWYLPQIFFDKRANSNLHLLTVNETAPEENIDDKDHLNAMQPLAIEATMINQNFSQQVGWVGAAGPAVTVHLPCVLMAP
jgi:hypothetical protein